MSMNVLSWNMMFDTREVRDRRNAIHEFLEDCKVDVILLQEVPEDYVEFFELCYPNLFKIKYHNIRNTYIMTIILDDSLNVVHYGLDSGSYNKSICTIINGEISLNNVHLPLDVRGNGERLNAMKKYLNDVNDMDINKMVMMGDMNPINMVDEMMGIFDSFNMKKVDIIFDNDEYPVSTFYGKEFEPERFQKFNEALIFDLCVSNFHIKNYICLQKKLIDYCGGLEELLSDHFPCVVTL